MLPEDTTRGAVIDRIEQSLLAAHKDSDARVRLAAIKGSVAPTAALVVALIAALRDKQADNRSAAATRLGEMGAGPAVDPLAEMLLHDRELPVRIAAAEALGQIGDLRAVQPLQRALKDKEDEVKLAAAQGLLTLGEAGAADALVELLERHRVKGSYSPKKCNVRVGTALTLAAADHPRAAELLFRAYADVCMASADEKGAAARHEETGLLLQAMKSHPDLHAVMAAANATRQTTNARLQAVAATVLGAIGALHPELADRAVDSLLPLLSVQGSMILGWDLVRASAAAALGTVGSPRGVEPLARALRDSSNRVRPAALEGLLTIEHPSAVVALIPDPMGEHWAQQAIAQQYVQKPGSAHGLGHVVTTEELVADWICTVAGFKALSVLANALADRRREMRQIAALAMVGTGSPDAIAQVLSSLTGLKCETGEVVRPAIAVLAGHKDAFARHVAAEILGKLGDTQAVQPLIKALEDRDGSVRLAAIAALGRLADPQAVEPLTQFLQSRSRAEEEADAAARSLRWFDRDVATPPLMDALSRSWDPDASRYLRHRYASVCWALGELGSEQAVARLGEALRHQDSAAAAAIALVKIGTPGAARAARVYLDPGPEGARGDLGLVKQAIEILVAIGQPALEPLLVALRKMPSLTPGAAVALGMLADPEAVEPLITALEDKREDVRIAAAGALGRIADPRAAEPLARLLADKSHHVRQAAIQSLAQVESVPPQVAESLLPLLGEEPEDSRMAVALAIGRSDAAQVAGRLGECLKDRNWKVRQGAAYALAFAGASLFRKSAGPGNPG